jgi:hypothetical protein
MFGQLDDIGDMSEDFSEHDDAPTLRVTCIFR